MINLSKSGDTIVFEFINNGHYLNNGTIEVPVNSLSLVTDSSNMCTFYRADSHDIFISATYDELGKTKAEMLEWFEENMVAPQGGGGGGVTSGQVQTMIDDSVSGFADSVLYNSTSKYVEFYHGGSGGTKVYEFDASDFVIDGMVDDVRIETISGVSYLVIDFNTASGKEDIQIPLTNIFDPSNYYTKTETNTLLGGKQDTLSAGTNITIVDNVISAEGGGKAVSGGTNISITSGETADTINCTLPMSTDSLKKIVVDSNYSSFVTSDAAITAGSLSNNILIGNNTYNIKGIIVGNINNNLIIGSNNTSELRNGTRPTLDSNLVVGSNNTIKSAYSLLVGANSTISGGYQFAIGYKQQPKNEHEISLGRYNVSSSGSSTFGDSGNTLFSLGNGTSENARHNAFEIRQNGDIYITSGGTDIKLQDNLGSAIEVSSAITSGDTNPVQGGVLYDKFDEVEQVTAANTTALGGLSLVKLTQAEYDALSPDYDSNTLYVIVN